MTMFTLFLKIVAAGFFLVGLLHLALGPGADVLLGANLDAETIRDPVLDSQNRFYGVVFTLYGAALMLCAVDMLRYARLFQCTIWIFFAGGLARVVSLFAVGMPTAPVLLLLAIELVLPPVLAIWHRRLRATDS